MNDINENRRIVAGDATVTTFELRSLKVAQIKPYEHNPRRSPNAAYDRIKASIRADGLGQPLVVTRRPGDTDYIVHAGGNSRLRIVKELFAESNDSRFETVLCLVRPWRQEADVLLAHLKENDLRGDLVFFDKALAITEAKRFLEEDAREPLTQVQFAEILAQRGYSLSQGLISQMAYAVERLQSLLPLALASGMGRPQVAKIRALERAVRAVWLERLSDPESEFDEVFEILCQRYDSPDWDLAVLRRALEAEVAERGDSSIHVISMALDAHLAGRAASGPVAQPDTDCDVPTDRRGNRRSRTDEAKGSEADHAARSADSTNHAGTDDMRDDSGNSVPESVAGSARQDVKSLRARLWTLASRLAQRNGMGDLVQAVSGHGLGFVLQDVPDPALFDQLDEDDLAQVSMIWWHLAACAELTVAPLDALLPALPEDSVLRRALVEQDAGLLFASVWTLDPGHMGYRLWRRLDDRDWQDLLSLMDAYRVLRKTAAANEKNLWSRS